jgi:type VI secretion system protein
VHRDAGRLSRAKRSFSTLLLMLFALSMVTACSGFSDKIKSRFGGKVSFMAQLERELNQDFPLAVDLVIFYDKELLDEIGKLSAREWFAQREQSVADNEPERLEVHSWEWVPPRQRGGSTTGIIVVDHRLGAHGAIVFANYFTPGDHRFLIDPLESFTLELRESDFEPGPPPSPQQTKAAVQQVEADKKAAKRAAKKAKKKAKAARKASKAAPTEGDS